MNGILGESLNSFARPKKDTFQRAIVGQHSDQNFRGARSLGRCVRHLRACRLQRLSTLAGAVVNRKVMACPQQTLSHGLAHVAEPDEAHTHRCVLLPVLDVAEGAEEADSVMLRGHSVWRGHSCPRLLLIIRCWRGHPCEAVTTRSYRAGVEQIFACSAAGAPLHSPARECRGMKWSMSRVPSGTAQVS